MLLPVAVAEAESPLRLCYKPLKKTRGESKAGVFKAVDSEMTIDSSHEHTLLQRMLGNVVCSWEFNLLQVMWNYVGSVTKSKIGVSVSVYNGYKICLFKSEEWKMIQRK